MLYINVCQLSDDLKPLLTGDEVIITPNPGLADSARTKWGNQNAVTMSHFLKENLSVAVLSKRDLLHQLLTVWNATLSHESADKFFKIFQWYTDFRGHTLSPEIAQEAFLSTHVDWHRPLQIIDSFWRSLDLIDEHRAYQLMGENTEIEGRRLFFWGFSHFSGTQVDMLQQLGKRNEIQLLLPLSSWENKKNTDWPSWFELGGAEIRFVNKSENKAVKNVSWAVVNENDFEHFISSLPPKAILMPEKEVDWDKVLALPLVDYHYKGSWEHLEVEFRHLCYVLDQFWFGSRNLKLSRGEWLQHLQSYVAQEKGNLKALTLANLFWKEFQDWEALSSEKNSSVTVVAYQVFKQNVEGLLPRLWVVHQQNEVGHDCYSLASIDNIPSDSEVTIFSLQEDKDLQDSSSSLSEELIKILAPISPLRNTAFELSLIKAKLDELCSRTKVTLVQNSTSVERSLFWQTWLEGLNVEKLIVAPGTSETKNETQPWPVAREQKFQDHFSPTSLQTFLDCPFQYKAKYLDKLQSFESSPFEFLSYELGQIEHKLIEKFFPHFNVRQIEQAIDIEFGAKKIDWLSSFKAKNEILMAVENGIFYLNSLKNAWSEINFGFERKLDLGRADVLFQSDNFSVLLDFKRSSASIPSANEFLKFDKIQLWYYLKRIYKKGSPLVWGWVNLLNLDESLLFSFGKEVPGGLTGVWKVVSDEAIFEEYSKFENELQLKISQAQDFLPSPRTEAVCEYCSFKLLCPVGRNL